MQSTLNYLKLSGVISEVANSQLASGLSSTDTSCEIAENNGFHTTIGGSAASSSNPGFIRILGAAEDGSEDEIIAYSGLSGTNNKQVNFITNG